MAEPARTEVDALVGPAMVEFGTDWCGHCRAAQPGIAEALGNHPGVRHLKVTDGAGQPLGRSFRVTLWPTLIFLRDGKEASRLMRPLSAELIAQSLASIESAAG